MRTNNIDLSIITIVNKENIYNEFLEDLKSQEGVKFELIPIFNLDNKCESARELFNHAAQRCKGKWLCFSHPDIRLLSNTALKNILDEANSILATRGGQIGVIGVAGAIRNKNDRVILSNIYHGKEKTLAGVTISKTHEIETVDECFFLIKKDYFLKYNFSSEKGFHLYAVEYCLDCLENNLQNYVVPANIWHLSDGRSLGPDYVIQLKRLIKKKQNKFDLICTTVKAWKTKGVLAKAYLEYYYYKQIVKRMIKK